MTYSNGVMMQYFHWYLPDNGTLWNRVRKDAKHLAEVGFNALWLPPAYKGSGKSDVGYGVYDLFDLGEFDQKGTVPTKYGTKAQYLDAIAALHEVNIHVYADIVFNHMMGADASEPAKATPYARDNRLEPKGEMYEIESYSHFYFPGRKGKYSTFEWHWENFDAIDYDANNPEDSSTIYVFEGKQFDDYVSLENGNFDYLMGCDLDFDNEWVRGELEHWGKWYLETTGVDGFRLDAVKHIAAWFFPQWLDAMQEFAGKALFAVGEYWENDVAALNGYIDNTQAKISLFDVPLHYNFHEASQQGQDYDLRSIFDGTLVQQQPTLAVTFVANHDSQALQDLESVVEPWFKPLAYALILLREAGYPCVFYPDYYGTEYEDAGSDGEQHKIVMPPHRWLLDKFLFARQNYGYGPQYDYLDHCNVIGWTRLGDADHPKAIAVLMSNGDEGFKSMEVGQPNAKFVDLTEHIKEPVLSNEEGWGEFRCKGGSVSIWVQEDVVR